eukprot:m.81756 g.81756  ORF g.81756 m.81756 type:complete len:754 (+) comp12068_c0_seq5:47-2308(+)
MLRGCAVYATVLCLLVVLLPSSANANSLYFRMCFPDPKSPVVDVDVYLTSERSGTRTKVFEGIKTENCSEYSTHVLTQGAFNVSAFHANDPKSALFETIVIDFVDVNATHFTLWYDEVDGTYFETKEGVYDNQLLNVAYVRVFSVYPMSAIALLTRNTNCYRCRNVILGDKVVSTNTITDYFQLQVDFPEEISACTNANSKGVCVGTEFSNQTYYFGERGFYTLIVNGNGDIIIQTDIEGDAEHGTPRLPILYAFVIIVSLFIVWYVPQNLCPSVAHKIFPSDMLMHPPPSSSYLLVNNADKMNQSSDSASKGSHAIGNPKKSSKRVQSLDSFRGTALTIMIFVNYGGGGYNFFDHSKWNGLTVADLVFPWFVWIMGTSMAIAFNSLFGRNTPMKTFMYKILRRSILLFAIGVVFINVVFDTEYGRVPGVLQRFAISYLIVALVILFVPKLTSWFYFEHPSENAPIIYRMKPKQQAVMDMKDYNPHTILRRIPDVAPYALEWLVMILLVVVYLCLTFLLPVPGCPTGYIGPGGLLAEFGKFEPEGGVCSGAVSCCEGGAAGHIDRWLLGWKHIYQSPTSQDTYGSGAYDPEGILGSLTSAFICYLGLQAGKIIVHHKGHKERITRWLTWGVVCCGIAAGLCAGSKNDGIIPLSKNLWSLSFVLLMAGFGFIALTVFYILIDVYHVWDGAPFRFVGINSIFIYVFHETFQMYFPLTYQWDYLTHGRALFMNVSAVSLLVLLCYYCYKIDFFVKI